jgi:hypothetical protein
MCGRLIICVLWSGVLEKMLMAQLIKKFPVLYGTEIFINILV